VPPSDHAPRHEAISLHWRWLQVVLVLEDDDMVRKTAVDMLQSLG